MCIFKDWISCSLDVLYGGGLGIYRYFSIFEKNQILIHYLVIKTLDPDLELDPDPHWPKLRIRTRNETHADQHASIKFGSRTARLFCGLTWPAESRLAVENFFTILLSEGFCSGFLDLLPGVVRPWLQFFSSPIKNTLYTHYLSSRNKLRLYAFFFKSLIKVVWKIIRVARVARSRNPVFVFFTIYTTFYTKIMQLSHQMLSAL